MGTVALAGLLVAFPLRIAGATSGDPAPEGPKPTVVLVHGAWADASGWDGVARRLQDDGYTVIAPANPLRGVQSDSAYLSSMLATISGRIVLVGHSYGGFVITNAATANPNMKALVYIAAFAPDNGVTPAQILAINPGSQAAPPNLTFRPYPGGVDTYITPSAFHEVFCADVPSAKSALMAAEQRPLESSANPRVRAPGRRSRRGTWSPVTTTPFLPRLNGSWQSAPGPSRSRSNRRTSR